MNDNLKETWYFYHKIDKTKFGPLTLKSLCLFLITNEIGLDNIFICKKGWAKWQMGLETEEFISEYKIQLDNNNELPPMLDDPEEDSIPPAIPIITKLEPVVPKLEVVVPNLKPVVTELEAVKPNLGPVVTELEAVIPNLEPSILPKLEIIVPKEPVNQRKHPRVELELKVIFVADKKTFRTKTKDLSLGGIQIADALPESFFNKNIQVFISSQDLKVSIKFEAVLLPNRSSTKFIQFLSQTEGSLKFLESWLNSVSANSGHVLKKIA